jgi:hypothetical protein
VFEEEGEGEVRGKREGRGRRGSVEVGRGGKGPE